MRSPLFVLLKCYITITFVNSISITPSSFKTPKKFIGTPLLLQDPRGESKLNSRVRLESRGDGSSSKTTSAYNCRKNDSGAQQACLEYCTHFKGFREGVCSLDQRSCLCRSPARNPIRVNLYKPLEKVKKQTTPPSKKVLSDKGDFDCDDSLEAKSICQVFCNLKGSKASECGKDGKTCLCFTIAPSKTSTSKKRQSRNMIGMGLNEERVISNGESSLRDISGRRRRPLLSSRPVQLPPYLPGCNAYSCMGKCPRHCDSLCTMNMECFCSCPEDSPMYYDYPEPYYDIPFFG